MIRTARMDKVNVLQEKKRERQKEPQRSFDKGNNTKDQSVRRDYYVARRYFDVGHSSEYGDCRTDRTADHGIDGGADARQRTGRGEGKRPRMSKVHGRKIAN